MKKLLTGILAFTLILTVYAQQPNEEEKQFVKHLKELGYVQQDMDEHLYNLLVELENDTLYEKYKEDKDYVRMKMNNLGYPYYNFELQDFELNSLDKRNVKEIVNSKNEKPGNDKKISKQAVRIYEDNNKYKARMLSIDDEIVVEDYFFKASFGAGGLIMNGAAISGKTSLNKVYVQVLDGINDSTLFNLNSLEKYKKIKEKVYSSSPKKEIGINNNKFETRFGTQRPFGVIFTDSSGKIILIDIRE